MNRTDTFPPLGALFNPKSIAIVGASKTIGKWGFTFLLHLIKGGYTGEIYPVNPTMKEILGKKVYPSISALPGPVDTAFILIPPDQVAQAIADCGKIGVTACVVITAGFKEVGPTGASLEQEIAETADKAGVMIVGPNCAGIASPYPSRLYCMMQPNFPPAGHIAVVSQSGNLAGSLMHLCWKQDIGISRCVSVGNQVQMKTEDFLEYFITDDRTHVVLAYIESVADGKRFMETARRLTRSKPFIVIKGGKTSTGSRAAKSHTGAIAGSDAAFDAVCRQCGIIRVDDVEDMFDTAAAFLSQPLPRGNRVGIVANGGGWGVIMADACAESGLNVVELPDETLRQLDKRLPPWWNRQNPVDLVAGMSRGAFFKSLEALAGCDAVDSLIAMGFGYGKPFSDIIRTVTENGQLKVADYVSGALRSDERGKHFILDLIRTHQKPVLLTSEYGIGAEADENRAILDLRKANILSYPSSEKTARILARLVQYGNYRSRITCK
ncbi:MAG: CoA-binding protein [Desulfobacterales bacterium]